MRRTKTLFFERLEKRMVLAVTNVFAINAGGPAISGTPNWAADTSAAPSARSNATAALSQTYEVDNIIDLTHPSVSAGTPMALFQDERFDTEDGAEMQWDFAVTPGLYEVRLYFAEIYDGSQSVGARVFDVSIEGTTVLNDYDVFAEVGGYKAVVKTFQVTSNANLDIDFTHVAENPAVKAIQILAVTPDANTLGVSPSSLSFGSKALGSTTTQTLTLTNPGGAGAPSIVIDATNLTGTDAAQFSDGFNDAANVTLAPGASTSIAVNFTPTSNGAKSASLSIIHSGSNSPINVPLSGTGGTTTVPIGFGKGNLVGANLNNPTSLQFGPDGRLYVSEQEGLIKVYSVARNAANTYAITAVQTITAIQSIPNHDDNGVLNASVNTRLVTGLFVTGTAANPILYVTSSDPRIGAGPDGQDLNLDTNSGILSRLSWNGTAWVKLDLVRGLPRSEENHASNGMALDKVNNILYIGQGGNTNMGAPSANFALLPEYALSAAILSVDLGAIGNTTYDLPTLNDETRSGTADANDPFGGNDGKNQAKLVPGGPVQVYASGFRNPYDVLITQAGKLYSIDNGPNAGWGDVPLTGSGNPTTAATAGSATNSVHEPGDSFPDNLHLITGTGYYAGHPNPTRANLANTFNTSIPQSPVATANPVEGAYREPGVGNGALALFDTSTNGLTEYTASNFGGALKGDILAASFSDQVFRLKLNAAGNAVTLQQPLFNNVGMLPLDVIAQGDSGPFPGTIWVADYEANAIFVFEPNDFDPNGPGGTGADDPALDEDGDGYNNHDEIVNGTNPLSAGDVPPDWDHDFMSNLLDNDDDNDVRSDTSDTFAIDQTNGKSVYLPVEYTWENDDPHSGGLLNLGFTGLMTNGSANYEALYNPNKMTAGGAAGVVTIDAVSEGDATGATNTQDYAFQFGVDVQPGSGPFTARTRIVGPFAGLTPQSGQSMGLFIGTGDQDNYFKLIVSGAAGGGVQWIKEVGGVVTNGTFNGIALPGPSAVDLYLTVNPSDATVQARYTVTSSGVTGALINLGTPIAIPSSWWTGSMGLAVGIISSSAGPAPTFPATWDFLLVTPETTQTLLVISGSLDFGNVPNGTTATRTLTLTNAGGAGDPSIVIDATTLSGVNAAQFSDSFNDAADVTLPPGASTTINVSFNPSATGSRTATLSVAHSGANTPLIVPLAGMAEQASTGNVLIEVTPGLDPDINASTYGDDSFQITNNSGGSTKIQSVRFDLTGAMLPDVVFDPEGTAGDSTSKDFTPDSASAVGLAGHTFSVPKAGGGYSALEIQFTDFGPGEFFNFSVDTDPTSIKGADAPGPNESGSVSGLEMSGATVTVTFSNGSVQTTNLFREAGSVNGGRAILKTGAPPKPTIQLLGAAAPATLSNPDQTVRVTGPVGATVALLQTESGLFVDEVPGGGFDLDPYEANSVIAVTELTAVIGSAGYVDIPVTLTNSATGAGLNHFVAAIQDASGRAGATSPVLVVQFDSEAEPPVQNYAPVVNAGTDQTVTLPDTVSLVGAFHEDGLPTGSTPIITWSKVSGPGTINFANPAAAVTSASISAGGTYTLRLTVSDGELSSSDELSIVVDTAASLPGDHNQDDSVDAADYVLWRKTLVDGQQGYDVWRTNFGASPQGAGSVVQGEASVSSQSEPTGSDRTGNAPLGLASDRATEPFEDALVSAGPGNDSAPTVSSPEMRTQPAILGQLWIAERRESRFKGRDPERAFVSPNKCCFHDEALLSWLLLCANGRNKESLATDESGPDASLHDVTDEVFDGFIQALRVMVSSGVR